MSNAIAAKNLKRRIVKVGQKETDCRLSFNLLTIKSSDLSIYLDSNGFDFYFPSCETTISA